MSVGIRYTKVRSIGYFILESELELEGRSLVNCSLILTSRYQIIQCTVNHFEMLPTLEPYTICNNVSQKLHHYYQAINVPLQNLDLLLV